MLVLGAGHTTTATPPTELWHAQQNDILLASLWPLALVLVVLIISIAAVNVKKAAIASAEVIKKKAIEAGVKEEASADQSAN